VSESRWYPLLGVEATGSGIVSRAGAVALARTGEVSGLSGALSAALAPWRKPLAIHDPGKIIADLAIAVALGGDCLADVAVLRSQPRVFGPVASDPTVSRLIAALAADAPAALAAIAAARHAGVPVSMAIEALAEFQGVKRRMEVRGRVNGVTVYDDFAHHPTAIATTLQGLRNQVGSARILLVLEPRSNTMRMGVHSGTLAASMQGADRIWLYEPEEMDWSLEEVAADIAVPVKVSNGVESIVEEVVRESRPGDHILVMSNGAFGGIHGKLLERLEQSSAITGAG